MAKSNQNVNGVFSTGEQTFKEFLDFSSKKSADFHNTIETNYALQARLGNYWKNNPAGILKFSEKFSGETGSDNKTPNPLGGPIDYSKNNIVNRQDSSFLSKEFDFWNANSKNNTLKISNNNNSKIINAEIGDSSPKFLEGFGKIKKPGKSGTEGGTEGGTESGTENKLSSSEEETKSKKTLYICCCCLIFIILAIIIAFLILNE